MKLKPYGDPIAWREASLADRLKALVYHYCTGPCGQSQQVGEIRSNTQSTLTEARTQLAAVTAERDRLREACEHISFDLCYCEGIGDAGPCYPCMAKQALAATEPKGE